MNDTDRALLTARGQSQDDEDEEDDSGTEGDDGIVTGLPHVTDTVLRQAWDHFFDETDDGFLFGARRHDLDIATLHPGQAHIFRLWQIFLDNINPIFKTVHGPTIQTRLIDAAASDWRSVNTSFQALMFSIYCAALHSLDDDAVQTLFGSSKRELLSTYQLGCQQALLISGVLKTQDRECLTALFLYLVSRRPDTHPQSLNSMLAIAVRLAQRMGIHSETANAKCPALEAELRRRLWWALTIYDNRIGELADFKSSILATRWDCKCVRNVNDVDMRSEMETLPASQDRPTDAIFAVLRSLLSDHKRLSAYYQRLQPANEQELLQASSSEQCGTQNLERLVEERYLAFCNPQLPLHVFTIWTTRSFLAKALLLEQYVANARSSAQHTDEQRDTAASYAIRVLVADTKTITSPLTKGYQWWIAFHFPMPSYIHLIQDLRKRPSMSQAGEAWQALSENYEARFMNRTDNSSLHMRMENDENPVYKVFSRLILQAWAAREAALNKMGKTQDPPLIVTEIKRKTAQMRSDAQSSSGPEEPSPPSGMDFDDFPMQMPMDFNGGFDMDAQGFPGGGFGFPDFAGQGMLDGGTANQMDWTLINWDLMHPREP